MKKESKDDLIWKPGEDSMIQQVDVGKSVKITRAEFEIRSSEFLDFWPCGMFLREEAKSDFI